MLKKFFILAWIPFLLIACVTNQSKQDADSLRNISWAKSKTEILEKLRMNPHLRVQETEFESIYIQIRSDNSFASSDANPSSQLTTVLDELVQVLKAENDIMIVLEGHADNTGSSDENIKLSSNRAKAVADYFKEQGLMQNISHIGYGADKPITKNFGREGRAVNRRVDIIIKPIQ